jgi:hypothetical protein
MTRFGVMKHLKVLEKSGLIVTKRRGCDIGLDNGFPIRKGRRRRPHLRRREGREHFAGHMGKSCLLKVTHDQLREGANSQLYGRWPMVLSGLTTLLETGEMLTTPGSLRWSTADRFVRRSWSDVGNTASETSLRAGRYAVHGILVCEVAQRSRRGSHPDFDRYALLLTPVRVRTGLRLLSAV